VFVALISCGRDANQQIPESIIGRRSNPALVTGPAYDFAYDERGRLVSVAAPTGESAQYVYDAAGNILEIRRFAAGTLTIMGFFPSSGGIGQVVTVIGAGFSTTPAQNTLQLNGLAATVLSSTSTQLTFAVPTGATTGPISVTVGTSTATTGTNVFTVTNPTVAITDFSPKLGRAGTLVAISGQGFDTLPANNRVYIGRALATVSTPSTTTSLQAVVSCSGPPGQIRVASPLGSATSTADFYFLPGTYSASDIASTDRMQIGGPTKRLNIPTAGKTFLVIFDANQGQILTAFVSTITLAGTTLINLYGPDSSPLISSSVTQGGAFKLDFGQLSSTGTYTIAVQAAATSTGSVDLQLLPEATGVLTIDGPAMAITQAMGQNGRYTFSANANDLVSLSVTSFATNPAGGNVSLYVYSPNGTSIWSDWASNRNWQLPQLAAGIYTLRVIPSDYRGVSFTASLSHPLTGTLTLDGPATRYQTSRVGQWGEYTFTGTAGQNLTMQATAGPTYPTGIVLRIFLPDGSLMTSATLNSNTDIKFDLAPLAATGTYRVELQPNGADSGTVDLRLVSEATGSLTIDGAATVITLGTAQNGRYTFSANANDLVGLGVTSFATNPAGATVLASLYNPSGTLVWSEAVAAGNWKLPQLTAAGTYTMRVLPSGTAGASLTVLLSRALTGTLTLDGPATHYQTSRVGQWGQYTFTGTAGQNLTMQATAGPTYPHGIVLRIFLPDGSFMTYTNLYSNYDIKLDLSPLPATGTYRVELQPYGVDTGAVDLRLVSEATGTLIINGAATTITLGTAQNGRYTFSANANDLVTLTVASFVGGNVMLRVSNPSGTEIWVNAASNASWQLPQLTAAGTYTLRVVPSSTAGASMTAGLTR
jgi:YD repeat-containing protein